MAVTNAFHDAVKSGNVRRVRIMMKDSLLVDPTFGEFGEMEKAAASMRGLYDPHDGREFELDRQKWDDSYMNKQMARVVLNFSHERIGHLKDVVHKLRPAARAAQPGSTADRGTHQGYKGQERQDGQEWRYHTKIAAGAAAGAAVGGVAASIVGITVVGGAIVGAAAGSAAIAITSNGGR